MTVLVSGIRNRQRGKNNFGYSGNHMAKKIPYNETNMEIIGLFLDDYLKKMHLRKMAKLLKTTHRTVAFNLEKLEKLRIFKSKTEGKSKNFYPNMDNTLTEHYMIAAENYKTISFLNQNFLIKKITESFEEVKKPDQCIVLFGSYAKGEARKASDIDLLLINPAKNYRFIKKAEDKYGKEINAKKTTIKEFAKELEKKNYLAREIAKNHVILSNPSIFVKLLWRYYENKR